jgi:small subunit ribosomal protein S7
MSINLKYSLKNRAISILKYENHFLFYSFLGKLVKNGKKNIQYRLLNDLFLKLKKDYPTDNPKDILLRALQLLKPLVNLRLKKVAGINYQLPCPINEERAAKVAVTWFFQAINERSEKDLVDRIYMEIIDLLKGKSGSKQRKDSFEKIALDNRPFIFFLKR